MNVLGHSHKGVFRASFRRQNAVIILQDDQYSIDHWALLPCWCSSLLSSQMGSPLLSSLYLKSALQLGRCSLALPLCPFLPQSTYIFHEFCLWETLDYPTAGCECLLVFFFFRFLCLFTYEPFQAYVVMPCYRKLYCLFLPCLYSVVIYIYIYCCYFSFFSFFLVVSIIQRFPLCLWNRASFSLLIISFVYSSSRLTGYGIHHCFARSLMDQEVQEPMLLNFYADYYTMAGIAVASCIALCPAVGLMGRRGGLLMFMIITALASLLQLGLLNCECHVKSISFSWSMKHPLV